MSRGLAYDSDEGRAYAGAITAIMTGEAYRQSAVVARDHGRALQRLRRVNEGPFLRVIGKHRDAAHELEAEPAPANARGAGPHESGTRPSSWARSTATATPR